MKLRKHFFADFEVRPRRTLYLLKLHDVRKVGKNLGRLGRSGGIDQRLAWMIRVRGIGENALAWMEGVRAFRWKRLFRFTPRARLGLRNFSIEQRKIINRPRPRQLNVVERWIATRCGRKLWKRHDEKHDMPQGCCNHGAARNSPLHPAFLEKSVD